MVVARKNAAGLGFGLALVPFVALGGACDKSPFESDRPIPAEVPPPRAVRGVAAAMSFEGGIAIERADPPPPAGDLREDVARFTSLDTCVAQHSVLDPLVGDAVRSIGYDTLLRDACRVLQAIKTKDSTVCEAITASSLSRRCETLLGIALQDPEKCPWEMSSQKQRGRDAMCLAVATRDPRTCAVALESTQATCEALASGDPSRCAKASSEDRAACARDVERYQSVLSTEHDAHETSAPTAHLTLHGAAGTETKDPQTTDFDLSPSVSGGAVVAAQAIGGAAIELARDLETTLRLPTRTDRSHLAASIVFDAGGPKVTKLTIDVPHLPELSCPSPHCTLTVTVPKTDPKRGATLSATIEGTIEIPDGKYQVKLQVDTYVRDVVGRMAIYGGR